MLSMLSPLQCYQCYHQFIIIIEDTRRPGLVILPCTSDLLVFQKIPSSMGSVPTKVFPLVVMTMLCFNEESPSNVLEIGF